jgi:protein O-mannosyl-transferase
MKRYSTLLVYSALILSTLLVFGQVRNFDFVGYDDDGYVHENPHVLNGLTQDGIRWAFSTGYGANWHPLTWLSLMLDCQMFGLNPGWMHLINLFGHLANILLLFAVLKKMTGSLWSSAFTAAAFALHPMHVESVAWISERKDVLSTLFLLLTMAAYAGYVHRPSVLRYLAAIVLFALGLMAKPMLVTLPFVLLLLDYWPLNRFTPPVLKTSGRPSHKPSPIHDGRTILYKILIEKIPFFVLAAASSVITFWVQQAGGAVIQINTLPLQDRAANAFLSYVKYMGTMFWPQNLAVFYPFETGHSIFLQAMMCVLLLLGISIFVIRLGRNQKYLPVGWFWFVGTLVPVIGLVQVGEQSCADRYTYVPYIGLFIILAWGLPQLLSKWPQRKNILGLSMVIILTILAICTQQQISYWKNRLTLFSHAVEVTQNNYVAYNGLGVALIQLGRWQEAIENLRQAVKNKPDYAEAYTNLGDVYRRLGRLPEAIDADKQAIKVKPDYAEAYTNLGIIYSMLGRWQEAIDAHKEAIKIRPDYAQAYTNLGAAYIGLGRWEEAIDNFNRAITIRPDCVEAYYNLGVVYIQLGRWQDMIEAFKHAIKIKPDHVKAHYNLGIAYVKTGNKNLALEEYIILKTLDAEQANNLFKLIQQQVSPLLPGQ